MLTFVRLDENLDVNYVYYSDTIRQEGDIEIPKECYLDAITFQKDENGQVIINRITEKEEELRMLDMYKVRVRRNRLLTESDWTQVNDVVLSNDREWKIYRQALRDITQTTEDPRFLVWPTPPQ